MKAELRVKPHSELPGQQVIEVWWQGEMIAAVYGANGPGVRVVSKHSITSHASGGWAGGWADCPSVCEVTITRKEPRR